MDLGCRVSVVDPADDARRWAASVGAANVMPSVDELAGGIEGVVVATPTHLHARHVEEILARRVPIFCEKPLCADVGEAESLVARARDSLFVMHKWRYHPGIERLREIAQRQELGSVIGLRTVRVGWSDRHDDVDPVWILAPHDLSMALEVFGEVPPPRLAIAERLGGSIVGVHAVLGDEPWMILDVSAIGVDRRREVRLYCRDGIAILPEAYSDHLIVLRDARGAERERWPISTEPPLLRELRAFVGFLRGGPPPRSGAADGLAVVRRIAELCDLATRTEGNAEATH
jgi:predicted dehydrogenase